jgi:mannan endo-1,4-beta-mannosidase
LRPAHVDVEVVPDGGTWFQLIQNGTQTINEGPNGLQRLDAVVEIAEELGMFVLLTLTNNWNPTDTNTSLPRNYLSNDYGKYPSFSPSFANPQCLPLAGGMDLYVRQYEGDLLHGRFYTEDTLIDAFKNYTTQVVSRYTNSPSVFGWEIANDPR